MHVQPVLRPGGVQRQVQGAGHLVVGLAARALLQSARTPAWPLRQRHPDPAGLRAQLHPGPPADGLRGGARQRAAGLLPEGGAAAEDGGGRRRGGRAHVHRLLRSQQ